MLQPTCKLVKFYVNHIFMKYHLLTSERVETIEKPFNVVGFFFLLVSLLLISGYVRRNSPVPLFKQIESAKQLESNKEREPVTQNGDLNSKTFQSDDNILLFFFLFFFFEWWNITRKWRTERNTATATERNKEQEINRSICHLILKKKEKIIAPFQIPNSLVEISVPNIMLSSHYGQYF